MGSIYAEGIAETVSEGLTTLEQALSVHLQSNHYPPVPLAMVPVCIAAIEAYERYEYEYLIDLPRDITWKEGEQAPAWAVVEDFHLLPFVKPEALDVLDAIEDDPEEGLYPEGYSAADFEQPEEPEVTEE